MTEATAPNTWTLNQWADFWRYRIGVNVIAADTKNKTIHDEWKDWQNNPIPEELHNPQIQKNKIASTNNHNQRNLLFSNTAKMFLWLKKLILPV